MVVESKIKGPKRLAQGVRGVGAGKKKNHQTVDSEDVEDQLGKDFFYKNILSSDALYFSHSCR